MAEKAQDKRVSKRQEQHRKSMGKKKPIGKTNSIGVESFNKGISRNYLDEIINGLPEKLVDSLTAKDRIILAAIFAGASDKAACAVAGIVSATEEVQRLIIRGVMGKAEQHLKIQDFMRISGINDFYISTKLSEFIEDDDKKVGLKALELSAKLKGHLKEKDLTVPATEIHLHIMQPNDAKPVNSNTSEVIDIDKLL